MMSDSHSQRVTIRLVRKYQFTAEFVDVPGSPSIVFDESKPLGDDRGPNPVAVLGAAIGSCLSATLASCLRRARVNVNALTVEVVTHVSRNVEGRYRIAGVDVELTPSIRAGDRAALERCASVFEDYCTVTASVRDGISVTVSVKKLDAAREDIGSER